MQAIRFIHVLISIPVTALAYLVIVISEVTYSVAIALMGITIFAEEIKRGRKQ